MEINDLKSVWKKANDQEKPGYWVSEEDVQKMIRNKSRLTIQRIKKAIRLKLVFLIFSCFTVTASAFLFRLDKMEGESFWLDEWVSIEQMGDMMVFMGVIVVAITWRSIQRYRKIISLERSSLPLSETLKQIRSIIQSVINTGIYGDVIGVPILVIWTMSVHYYGKTGFVFDIRLLYILIPAMVLPVLVYFKNSRFMHSRYGHHMQALNESLNELEATNAEKSQEEV